MSQYNNVGNKISINGVNYYSQDVCSNGLEYGYVYKNEQAFHENPDEVCYIPEHAFDDVIPVEIDGTDYYCEELVGGYTRKDLELMLLDDNGNPLLDEDSDPIDVECFFDDLYWCYPETRLNELT